MLYDSAKIRRCIYDNNFEQAMNMLLSNQNHYKYEIEDLKSQLKELKKENNTQETKND